MIRQGLRVGNFCSSFEILFGEVSKGLLAESQGDMPLAELVAGNDGTLGGDFSKEILPFV